MSPYGGLIRIVKCLLRQSSRANIGAQKCAHHAPDGFRVVVVQVRVTQALTARLGCGGPDDNKAQGGFYVPAWPAKIASTLNAHYGDKQGLEDQHVNQGCPLFVPSSAVSLRAEGFDASEDGTGRQNLVVTPINSREDALIPVAFQEAQTGCREYDTAGCLRANGPGHDPVGTRIRQGTSVRRLTPVECERLQGFPDGILKEHHLSPIDLGPGRGRGLRWHRGAVKAVIDTLHAEAQPKQKARVAVPKEVRPVLGKSPSMLFDELYNRGAAQ